MLIVEVGHFEKIFHKYDTMTKLNLSALCFSHHMQVNEYKVWEEESKVSTEKEVVYTGLSSQD